MFGTDAVARIKETDPRVYLAVGVLSLLKAIALRNHERRSRRELRDAGLFLGLGLVLYQRSAQASDGEESDDDDSIEGPSPSENGDRLDSNGDETDDS